MNGLPVDARVRLRVQPFEITMGGYAIVSAALSLFGLGPVSWAMDRLPVALSNAFDLMYLASGVLIMVGIMSGRLKLEAGGLAVLVSGAFIRLAVIVTGGAASSDLGFACFYVAMILAAAGRLHAIFGDEVTVTIREREVKS